MSAQPDRSCPALLKYLYRKESVLPPPTPSPPPKTRTVVEELREGLSGLTMSAMTPTGDPCPGQLYTPSRLPGLCWTTERWNPAQPAWPFVRRPVGTCGTA